MASIVLSSARLGFPFECESPFLFAVYHKDVYPPGNEAMGPDPSLLRGHRMGADFGNAAGWSMYHGMEIPGFPKHPHRGFETLTVTRQGLVDHTDSLGNSGRFGYGDCQWMTAGKGISHTEMFPLTKRDGPNVLELFQIWINLPRRTKMASPSFKMFWKEDLAAATFADGGSGSTAEVALIAGSLPGFNTPPDPPPSSYAAEAGSDILVVTVKLSAGASWTLPASKSAPAGLHRNAYFYAGRSATIGGTRFDEARKVKVRPDEPLVLTSGDGPTEVLILQGRDIGEPVVQHGPFVGNVRRHPSATLPNTRTAPMASDSQCSCEPLS